MSLLRLFRTVCMVSLCIVMAFVSVLPVCADDNIVSYTLSAAEMTAMLNAGRCGYVGNMSGSGYEFHGTLTFSPFDTGSDGVYAIVNNSQGGPNAQMSFTFEFPLNIKCLTCTISSAFGTKLINQDGTFSYLVPTDGWLGAGSTPFPTDIQQNHMPGKINTGTITNFDVLITNATFIYDDMTNVTGFQNYFKTGWGNIYNNQFLYCINAITYTGRKADIDDLVNAIDSLIQNNNDNTDRIIANQDKNTQEIKDQIWDSLYQAGNAIMDNDNANHQEDMQQREDHHQEDVEQRDKLWNDTYNPSDEEVGDYAGAIFDNDVQDQLKSKLGLFTFLDDTMQQLLSAFDDEGTAGTGLVMPALVVPINGVDYTVIESTTFDMADTLDQIPVLVAAIRFVSGIIIIFGFLSYLHRLKVRFFGAD